MKWITKLDDNVKIGLDVLVYFKIKQYMAGTFNRTGDKKIIFRSSDGAWTAELQEIQKFLYINEI